jgi:oligopeptide transport system substrate-binding protein
MLRLLSIPAALLILLAGAMAWSGSATQHRADFVFINRGDIITLDPNQMSYLQDMRMAYAMWEGLYTYEPITLEPIPGVASSAEVSSDKRVYTFHLRPEAKWSNGDPVTTADFVFAWRRMLESPGEYTYLFYYIKGAEEYVTAYAKGEAAADFASVGIEAIDAHTLRVTLNDPVAFFLDLCAFPPFLPLHKPSMERFAQRDETTGRVRYDQKFTRPPYVVTNGPFTLQRWDFKRRLFLEKNPHYWDTATVRSKSIEMVVVEDALTQLLRYESGSVDWVASVPTEVAAELKIRGRTDLRNFSGFGTTFLSFLSRPKLNSGKPNPLTDMRVRLALGMAIEKQTIVDTITRMGEKTATTFVPPDVFPGYQKQQGVPYDPARAKQLLAEAGYPNGGTLPGVSYLFRSDLPAAKELAQNLTRQWKQKLNLDIPLESAEAKVRRQRVNDRDYTICSADWIGDYGDPSTFTDKYRSNSENNDSVWVNKEYDQLVFQATKEVDEARRLRLLERAEKILLDEAPIFPLYYLTNQYLFRDEVKGINTNPRNMTMFKGVYVEPGDTKTASAGAKG